MSQPSATCRALPVEIVVGTVTFAVPGTVVVVGPPELLHVGHYTGPQHITRVDYNISQHPRMRAYPIGGNTNAVS